MTADEWLAWFDDDQRTTLERAMARAAREAELFRKEQEAAAARDENLMAQRELMALLGRPRRGD